MSLVALCGFIDEILDAPSPLLPSCPSVCFFCNEMIAIFQMVVFYYRGGWGVTMTTFSQRSFHGHVFYSAKPLLVLRYLFSPLLQHTYPSCRLAKSSISENGTCGRADLSFFWRAGSLAICFPNRWVNKDLFPLYWDLFPLPPLFKSS